MSKYLFGRIVKVIVGTSDTTLLLFDSSFRITFDIKLNTTSTTNSALIQIYNLSKSTRAQLENVFSDNKERRAKKQQLLTVTVYAGYALGDGYEILFNGNITHLTNIETVPDLITEIECGDGALPLKNTIISQSYKAGIDSNTIINQIARIMQLNISQASDYISRNIAFAQGIAFAGTAKTFMDKITIAAGLEWHIEKGQILITEKNKSKKASVILISALTGMLKSPAKIETPMGDASGNNEKIDGWKLTCLLIPDITPKQPIKIESKIVTGVYWVENVQHIGDNRGQAWNTNFDARFSRV